MEKIQWPNAIKQLSKTGLQSESNAGGELPGETTLPSIIIFQKVLLIINSERISGNLQRNDGGGL